MWALETQCTSISAASVERSGPLLFRSDRPDLWTIGPGKPAGICTSPRSLWLPPHPRETASLTKAGSIETRVEDRNLGFCCVIRVAQLRSFIVQQRPRGFSESLSVSQLQSGFLVRLVPARVSISHAVRSEHQFAVAATALLLQRLLVQCAGNGGLPPAQNAQAIGSPAPNSPSRGREAPVEPGLSVVWLRACV